MTSINTGRVNLESMSDFITPYTDKLPSAKTCEVLSPCRIHNGRRVKQKNMQWLCTAAEMPNERTTTRKHAVVSAFHSALLSSRKLHAAMHGQLGSLSESMMYDGPSLSLQCLHSDDYCTKSVYLKT